jgi:glucosamine--fructose-6-phosphate aminotransferase (isomerizing)
VLILACGTSYHAGLVARYWIEQLAGCPAASRSPASTATAESVPNPEALVVAISQSGETADTLAALKHARVLGQSRTLAICNVPESAIVREAALRFLTRAGPEIGVASTKAFTTQLAALFLLAVTLAKLRGRLDRARGARTCSHAPPAAGGGPRAGTGAGDRRLGGAVSPASSTRCSSAAACTTRSPWKAR